MWNTKYNCEFNVIEVIYHISSATGGNKDYIYTISSYFVFQSTDAFVLQLLNSIGDVLDLKDALHPPARPDFAFMKRSEIKRFINRSGHGSALIKVCMDFYKNV